MKNNVKYSIIISSVTVEEQEYKSYGIACINNDKVKAFIEDVSVDEKAVEKLVKLFNKLHLDPEQLQDAIEDSLS